jgi:outer membrane protein assembly factor BamE (lipoprotein component of BamABCDE complex)
MDMKLPIIVLATAVCISGITGCATNPATTSPLVQARVSVLLKKGVTTQQEVLEKLGPPNIITTDGGGLESWTYQKHSVTGGSAGAAIEGGGVTSNPSGFLKSGFLAGSLGGSAYAQTSKTVTLTVKFNRRNVVEDYKSLYTSF